MAVQRGRGRQVGQRQNVDLLAFRHNRLRVAVAVPLRSLDVRPTLLLEPGQFLAERRTLKTVSRRRVRVGRRHGLFGGDRLVGPEHLQFVDARLATDRIANHKP